MEHIFQQGGALLEKSEPLDAAVIEEELEELQRYRQEVFGRVERYYKKLIHLPVRPRQRTWIGAELLWTDLSPGQLADEDADASFSDRELDEPGDLSGVPWNERSGDGFLSPLASSGRSASLAAQLRAEHSGRDTPASVDSIPLEWDHDYDLSRGLESAGRALREQQSEEEFLQPAPPGLSGEFSETSPLSSKWGGCANMPLLREPPTQISEEPRSEQICRTPPPPPPPNSNVECLQPPYL